MIEELPANELLKRCCERPPNEAAWQEFVRRYDSVIRAAVAKTFRRRAIQEVERRQQFPDDLVDDLVQAVYVRLVEEGNRALKQFSGQHDNSIYQYLGIISINVVRDHFRVAKADRRPKMSYSLDQIFESDDRGLRAHGITDIDGRVQNGSQCGFTMQDIESALWMAVSRKHRDRDVLIFKLRYCDGLTLEEIRKTLDLDLSAIGIASLLNRINGKMRTRLTRKR